MEAAPFTLKVRTITDEVIETLLYGCGTWTLGKEHVAEQRTAHHRFSLRSLGFQRRQRSDHFTSYAKAFKKAQCERVETTVRKRRLLFAGGVQRMSSERLTRRVMFETMAVGEQSGPGRPYKNWGQSLADDRRVFRATEG